MEATRLRSGRQILIRPIRGDDGDRLARAYEHLSPETRYRRFLAVKPHLTSGDVRYLTGVDGHHHVALVAVAADDPERIIGVARFVRLEDEPEAAEMAVVVGDQFQGEGLGTVLVKRLARAALARGVMRFTASMLAENKAAHRLLHGLGGVRSTERHGGPIDELVIELASCDDIIAPCPGSSPPAPARAWSKAAMARSTRRSTRSRRTRASSPTRPRTAPST